MPLDFFTPWTISVKDHRAILISSSRFSFLYRCLFLDQSTPQDWWTAKQERAVGRGVNSDGLLSGLLEACSSKMHGLGEWTGVEVAHQIYLLVDVE